MILAKCLWRTGSIWPVDCEFDHRAKYRYALACRFTFCYFLEFYLYNFLELTILLGCKFSTFTFNTNFRYYHLPIIFYGAVFNQPLCINLQLRYFRFPVVTYFWDVQVTQKSYVIITLLPGLSLWETLYFVITTFFQVPKKSILNNIRNNNVVLWHAFCVLDPYFWIIHLWCICIRYWNNVTATFPSHLLLWHIFITSQLHYLFVQRVKFFMTSELC